jgi:hypothetical protein
VRHLHVSLTQIVSGACCKALAAAAWRRWSNRSSPTASPSAAPASLRAVRFHHRAGAGHRPDARRLADRQFILALGFPDQPAGGLLSLGLVWWLVYDSPALIRDRAALLKKGVKIDYFGFTLVVLGFGALQILLDRFEREDGFPRRWYLTCGIISAGVPERAGGVGSLSPAAGDERAPVPLPRLFGSAAF